ncbi:aspartate dehydrogenase [Acetobacteraceae bacterium H6797]|nr:aspartate dehydrogenase [Acetobacteraceae bacterium H6797]
MRLGLIGAGGMAKTVLGALAEALPAPLEHLSLLVRDTSRAKAVALLDEHGGRLCRSRAVHGAMSDFLADGLEMVAECAGHAGVREHGAAVLAAGVDLAVISIGVLADRAVEAALTAAAELGGARLILPAGAVGGIDALAALRLGGLEEVVYTGRKPPLAWKGTAAESALDLASLTEARVFFEGTAREAASRFPQNANVAATVALAGLGLDETRVALVADPGIARNVHEVSARGRAGAFSIRLEGYPSPDNPKTSLTAGLSMAREVLNRAGRRAI